jgi:hypothetical protein
MVHGPVERHGSIFLQNHEDEAGIVRFGFSLDCMAGRCATDFMMVRNLPGSHFGTIGGPKLI